MTWRRGNRIRKSYALVARELGVPAADCLVIGDSAAGVEAALGAGMGCVAVITEFTRTKVHESRLLDARWIVDAPSALQTVVERFIDKQEKKMTGRLYELSAH